MASAGWVSVLLPWVGAVAWHLVANQAVARLGCHLVRPPFNAPLQDLGHLLLPRGHLTRTQAELLHVWCAVPVAAAIWAGCGLQWARVHTLVLCLRPLCYLGTLLPDASGQGRKPGWLELRGGLHDLMFSGHTAMALSGACVLAAHGPSNPTLADRLLPGLVIAGCVSQSVLIVMTRLHYTVDVVVAWILTPLLCHFAHTHNYWLV